ncbi:probable receptor-like protein kinase At5g20050 [Elaeis guineensis]|uniref:probable receptor-like protein kinase At5g20050 n=1 Tax=Elaeis guineensis var. tenera TaxID=51953 RepID=UPI003C6D35CC
MEEALKKAKIVAAFLVAGLLVLLVILWVFLGHSTAFFLTAGFDGVAILAIFVWISIVHTTSLDRRRMSMARRSALEGEELRIEYSFLRKVAGLPTKFRYEVLAAATDDFHALIGRGSSASVFKGILDDGTPVAVKRIEGAEHGEREFRSEVSAIASVQHVNLVRLLGYCLIPGGPRFLVYDFIANGSLDRWIFPQAQGKEVEYDGGSGQQMRGGNRCLPWRLRYSAAIDVAKALAYLQHDCRARVLHLDVKPENILLDESFRAIVSDFGLSKLMGRDESRVVTTVRGTRGYLAPEWLIDCGISEKCDIYSYGMVLLEMVGGRRNVQLVGGGGGRASARRWSYFPKLVSEKMKEGRLMEVVDERLVGVEEGEVRRLVDVALWCIQEKAEARPSMARVVDMLEGRMDVDPPPETEMIIHDLLPSSSPTNNNNNNQNHHDGHSIAADGIRIREPSMSMSYEIEMSFLSGR